MFPAGRVLPGLALHSSAASPEAGSWVGVCAEKGEAGRPVTSGAGSYQYRAPCFWGRGSWGAVVPGPKRAGDAGLGDVPGPVLTKGAPLHLVGGAAPEKWSLAAGLSPGEVFLGCHFISIIAFFFFFKGPETDA